MVIPYEAVLPLMEALARALSQLRDDQGRAAPFVMPLDGFGRLDMFAAYRAAGHALSEVVGEHVHIAPPAYLAPPPLSVGRQPVSG